MRYHHPPLILEQRINAEMVPGLRVNTYLETPKDPHRLLWSKSGEKRGGLALGVSHRPIGRLGRSDSPYSLMEIWGTPVTMSQSIFIRVYVIVSIVTR